MYKLALEMDQQLMDEAQLSKCNQSLDSLTAGSEPALTYNRQSASPAGLRSGGGESPTVRARPTSPSPRESQPRSLSL